MIVSPAHAESRWRRWACVRAGIGLLALCVGAGCQSLPREHLFADLGDTYLSRESQDRAQALALFSYGLMHEMHQDFDLALDSYREALRYEPDNEELYFRLAMGLLHQRRYDEAVEVVEGLVERKPKSPRAHRWVALIYRAAGQLENSERAYQRWLKLEPDSSAPYIQLASLYLKTDEPGAALALLEKAIRRLDEATDVERAMVDILLRDGADKSAGPEFQPERDRAIELLQRIVEADPDDLYSLTKLAELHVLNQDIDAAVACYEKLEGDRPDDLRVKQRLAESYLSMGKQEKAVGVLEEIAEQEPDNPRVYLYLGELYQQLGETDKAVEIYERARAVDPASVTAYLRLALLRLEDHPDAAAETLVQGLERIPGDERLTEMLAYVYLGSKDYTRAVEFFERALELALEADSEISPNFYFNYAIALQRAGRWEMASAQLARAMKENVTFLDAYVQFVVRQSEDDEKEGAVAVLEKLAGAHPEQPRVFYYKGMLHNYLQEFEAAVAAFERVSALIEAAEEETEDIRGAQYYFWFGAACERSGDLDRAEAHFRTCIELEPDYAEAYNYLAYMWAEKGVKLDEALEMVTIALELNPDSGAFVDTLGWIYYMQGKYERALAEIERAAQLIPDDPTIMDHLGDVLMKLGNIEAALPRWKRSYVLDPENEAVAEKLSRHGVNLDALLSEAQPEAPEAEEMEEAPDEETNDDALDIEEDVTTPFPATLQPAGPVFDVVPEQLEGVPVEVPAGEE